MQQSIFVRQIIVIKFKNGSKKTIFEAIVWKFYDTK